MQKGIQLPEGNFIRGDSIPQHYRGKLLRGAAVFTADGDPGSIVIQTIEQPSFTIQFKLHAFIRPVSIAFRQGAAQLVSYLAIKNNIKYEFELLGRLELQQHQFALIHCNEQLVQANFEKGKSCQSLEISWSPEIVKEAKEYFTSLDQLNANQRTTNFFLSQPPQTAGEAALGIAYDILRCPFNDNLANLFYQNKIREYLLQLLVDSGKAPATRPRLNQEEWSMIDQIASMLRTEPAKKFPITELARYAKMNTMKLKTAFKEKYGKAIFEYHLDERLNEALRLLQQTDLPVKHISSLIGYKTSTSFLTKFREHFGFYVSDVTRNKK
jgi:AraC-like DNA-binding protein